MARMPGATWRPLKENATQSRITPTQVIFHTAVDAPGPTNLPGYFDRSDIHVESHFWVTMNGANTQMMDSNVRADANRWANERAISVETEDEGNPEGVPWTPAQLDTMAEIARWAHRVHGIPLVVCPAWDKPGLGFHSMFGAPSPWTPSRGKTCPGSTRIKQFYSSLIPSLTQEAAMAVPMTQPETKRLVDVIYAAVFHRPASADTSGRDWWTNRAITEKWSREDLFYQMLDSGAGEVVNIRSDMAALQADVRKLAQSVEAIGVGLAQANSAGATKVDVDALANIVGVRLAARLAP